MSSFRARWLNRRIWRWRWNKFKYNLNPDPEYEKYIAEERAKTTAFLAGHLEDCYVAQYPDWKKCPAGYSKFSEEADEHWWSGWPGAFCLKCFAGDLMESCIGGCMCVCHTDFWESYNEAMTKEFPKAGDYDRATKGDFSEK